MSVQIPKESGAILLPDTVLFPQGTLPLHIFESRYRKMLDDALEGHCMICVGTLTGEETEDPAECTERIGTVGLIRVSKQGEDGRSNLLLHGIARVEFGRWREHCEYPSVQISPMPSWPVPPDEAELSLETLRHAVSTVMEGFPKEVSEQMEEVLDAVTSPGALADLVAHQFVVDTRVRRALLEETSVGRRLHLLTNYLRGNQMDD